MAAPELTIPAVRVLENREDLVGSLLRMGNMAMYEMLSVLPDATFTAEECRSSWDVDVEMLDRGVDLRCIYPATAARRPDVMQYLSEIVARGARIRVSGATPGRILITDRSLAMVPEIPGHPSGRTLMVAGPLLVRGLYADFVSLWRAARPVGVAPEPALSPDRVREVLAVLRSGVTDGVAAKRLGVSGRTFQRRVSAVMELLGATSRFDAGVKATKVGWI